MWQKDIKHARNGHDLIYIVLVSRQQKLPNSSPVQVTQSWTTYTTNEYQPTPYVFNITKLNHHRITETVGEQDTPFLFFSKPQALLADQSHLVCTRK